MTQRTRTILSPAQSAALAMGRTLLVFETWARVAATPVDQDRAMLIDFAVQYPRSIGALVPSLPGIIRGHGIDREDLGDLFATRRFQTLREVFASTLSLLIARRLVDESLRGDRAAATLLNVTDGGRAAAQAFSTPLAFAIRSLAEAISTSWRNRTADSIRRALADALPDKAREAADLMTPTALEDD